MKTDVKTEEYSPSVCACLRACACATNKQRRLAQVWAQPVTVGEAIQVKEQQHASGLMSAKNNKKMKKNRLICPVEFLCNQSEPTDVE